MRKQLRYNISRLDFFRTFWARELLELENDLVGNTNKSDENVALLIHLKRGIDTVIADRMLRLYYDRAKMVYNLAFFQFRI